MTLKLGKLPARPGAVSLRFSDYANTTLMPDPPRDFGHETLIANWGMLGNDVAGNCFFAGSCHEIMLWNAEAGVTVPFDDKTALANYSEVTGYDPTQPNSDNGTDVASALALRRRVGFFDATGKRHKIAAYVALEPGNIEQLRYAAYYFDGVGIGVQFPEQWMESFSQGSRRWDHVASPNYNGGHYISTVAWRDGNPVVISWGQKIQLTPAAFQQNADEVYAYLTIEKLVNGIDLEGLNLAKLEDDLKGLTGVK
jgi:hypothetical protein